MIKINRKKEDCCGCSACINICPKHLIRFNEDSEGFLYPIVDRDACVKCGLCADVCPIINQYDGKQLIEIYAAKHQSETVRLNSSSGGIFTLLAEQVINEGGVVFGARFNDNWEVIHDYTETKEGLSPFRGSKYVQSYMGGTFKQVKTFLELGRKVMFSGTPCHIAGLKRYLRHEYPNLLTVDFVCHGVPSPKVWRLYLQEEIARQGERGKNTVVASPKDMPVITGINFRDKSTGWEKYSFVLNFSEASAEGEQNTVLSSVFTENPYMKAFLSNLILRPSCYSCPVKSGKSGADITIGDFWGIENAHPSFYDDMGCSVILVYNKNIIQRLLANLYLQKSTLDLAVQSNQNIIQPVGKPVNRGFFFYNFRKNRSVEQCVLKSTDRNITRRIRRYIFRILGL